MRNIRSLASIFTGGWAYVLLLAVAIAFVWDVHHAILGPIQEMQAETWRNEGPDRQRLAGRYQVAQKQLEHCREEDWRDRRDLNNLLRDIEQEARDRWGTTSFLTSDLNGQME